MNVRRLSDGLLGGGLLAILAAVVWSLQFYGNAARELAKAGLAAGHSIACLYALGGSCGIDVELAGGADIAPYLFWFGLLLFVGGFAWRFLAPSRSGDASPTQQLLIFTDSVSTGVGHLFAWCIVILTFAISYEVFSRYVLQAPTSWAYDASYILYGTLFIMAGAYALCRNGHVRGDFLYRMWPPRVQAGMDLVLFFLFFFPGILAFIYSGYQFAAASWAVNEHSSYSPAGPPIYHFKTLLPITGILMLLQGIAEVVRCLVCLRSGAWPQRLHDVEELEKVILARRQEQEARPS